MDLLQKLLAFFDRQERIKGLGLLALMLVGAGLETLGVGMVMPFVGLVSDPSLIEKRRYLAWVYTHTGSPAPATFVVGCGFAIIAVFLFKNIYLGFLNFIQIKFVSDKQVAFSRALMRSYIYRPYVYFLNRNTAELQTNLAMVGTVFSAIVMPLFQITIEVMILTLIMSMLVVAEPAPALVVLAALALITWVFYQFIRRKLRELGVSMTRASIENYKCIQQSFGGIKETKVLGREDYFVNNYEAILQGLTTSSIYLQVAQKLPALFIETIAVCGTILIVCIMLLKNAAPQTILPALSLFALATMRIMPSMTRIVSSLTLIRTQKHCVDILHADLKQLDFSDRPLLPGVRPPIVEAIELRNISYSYPGTARVLHNVSLRIPLRQSIAFVGPSGAGKTTLVDIILGLLAPTTGQVLVDGIDIQQDPGLWRNRLGYIPQAIHLSDDSIRRNIAFGIADSAIEDTQVWIALRAAQLETFVRDLPQGLDTFVGERGVRLSGGQRQRIGIARALYSNPEILVLDEATSALDHDTEKEVTDAIERLSGEKTLIIIAHRISTTSKCDRIYKLVNGTIEKAGTYAELFGGANDHV